MNFKNKTIIFSVALISLLTISCGTTSQSSSAYSDGYSFSYNSGKKSKIYEQSDLTTSGLYGKDKYDESKKAPKIIYSARLSMVVKKVDTTNKKIEIIAKKYKGYVNTLGSSRTVIRVESYLLTDAIKEIETLGNVSSKTVSGQDVTERYMDVTIRLDNAEKARKRYLDLLAKAENVEAALKVEKELERLNGTIDRLKGQLNSMNHLTQYSTITINIKEKTKPGILGYIGIGVYKSVKWLFVRG